MYSLICPDAVPSFLNVFDFSIAPTLLFYSYVPILALSLFVGLFIFFTAKSSQIHSVVFWFILSFTFWVTDVLILWTAAPVSLVMFFWQILALIEIAMYLLGFYLVYSFGQVKQTSWAYILALVIPFFAVAILAPTQFNLSGFDFQNCEAVIGPLWNYIYIFEAVGIVFSGYIGIKRFKQGEVVIALTRQYRFIVSGILFFLTGFTITNALGDATKIYSINLYGPIGMLVFVCFLGYVMVQYEAFGVKVLAARALITFLTVLIGSQYFFVTSTINYVLVTVTLLLTFVFGYLLVKSVQREVEQRQHIEELAKELEKANDQQVVLIHFITHQIKGFVAKSRNIFSMALEGDFGAVGPELKPMLEEGFRSDTKGATVIQEILNAANIKSGKVSFTMAPFDLRGLVEDMAKDLKAEADEKHLILTLNLGETPATVLGDRAQLVNVFKNLIDNSIKYTPSGEVTVSITPKPEEKKVLFAIKDTGIGITEDDMQNLFTEGGHGKESVKVNVDSTGFGLYIVKNIVDAHGGRVWAESEGAGKGSQFYVELPSA